MNKKLIDIDDRNYFLLNYNRDNTIAIIQGELAELITEISDSFVRNDYRKSDNYDDIVNEIADTLIQIEQLICFMSFKNNWNSYKRHEVLELSKINIVTAAIKNAKEIKKTKVVTKLKENIEKEMIIINKEEQ